MALRRVSLRVAVLAALLVALLPASAMAEPEWVGAETLAGAGGAPDVTTDAEGNSAAVWENDGHILVAERPRGGPWGAAEDLEPDGGADSQPPKIVATPGGELVAAWVGGAFGFEVHAARRPAGGPWSDPVAIDNTCCPVLQDLVVGADGTVLGFWTSQDGSPETAVKPPGSANFDPPQTLSDANAGTEVAVAPDGSAVAATPSDCGESGYFDCVIAHYRPARGVWSVASEPAGSSLVAITGLALTARADASYTVAWTEGPPPVSRRGGFPAAGVRSADRAPGASGAWSGQQTVALPIAGRAGCPDSFGCIDLASRGGELVAVWQQAAESRDPPNEIAAALRSGGGDWSPPEVVDGVPAQDAFPRAAFTGNGIPVAVWRAGSGGPGTAMRGAHRGAGGPWTPEPLDAPATDDVAVEFQDVVGDGEGNAVTGWSDQNGVRAAGFDGSGPRFTAFSVPAAGTTGAALPFSAAAADNWSGVAGIGWLFDDGGAANGSAVTHTYATAGVHAATATATDGVGNAAQRSGSTAVSAVATPTPSPTPTPTPTPEACGTTDRDQDGVGDRCDRSNGDRAPVPFKTVNATVVSGDVFVKLPGGSAGAAQGAKPPKGFVRLQGAETIPVGSTLDTLEGRVLLRSAADTRKHVQIGQFYRGRFVVRQQRRPRGRAKRRSNKLITELRLAGSSFRKACRTTASTSQRRKRRVRRLFGDARGSFRTRGRNAAATVRGTRWGTQDRCDGTLVAVQRGRVEVRDFVRRRTVVLKAGRTYLARRR